MAEENKLEMELELKSKNAERKLSDFEVKAKHMSKRINDFSFGGKFGAVGKTKAGLGVAGAVAGRGKAALSKMPGAMDMIAQFGLDAAQVLAPNTSGAFKEATAPLGALRETINAFGKAGANADPKAIQSFFDARVKMREMDLAGEKGVRNAIGLDRLEPVTKTPDALSGLLKDIVRILTGTGDTLKKIGGMII